MTARPITIAGGGLAGLSLGRALAQRGHTVELHESGAYPRHKVCGEFISGLTKQTSEALDLGSFLRKAETLSSVRWYRHGVALRDWNMPEPALGISRYHLDAALAEAFVAAGGSLHQNSRMRCAARTGVLPGKEGHIQTTGRLPVTGRSRSRWVGLKVHLDPPFALEADLEIHLGTRAYVGLSRIEGGQVNVCGLFEQRATATEDVDDILERYLQLSGLHSLLDRVGQGSREESSLCAVAGLDFRQDTPTGDWLRLGDSRGMIPPYTGHGMAMALESASLALDPLSAYVRGEISWSAACAQIDRRHRRLRPRLRHARMLHPTLYRQPLQGVLGCLARMRILPLNALYHLTHA